MLTRRTLALGPVIAVALATAVVSATSAVAGASLQIEPASVAVTKDQTFDVQVVQDAPLAISGAQASLDFDPSILQVAAVTRGAPYEDAQIFEPSDLASSIRAANVTGHLAQIAAAFLPPRNVPAGTASFLVVRFRAVGCGETDLKLPSGPLNAQMISGQKDGYGSAVPVVTAKGHVATCVGQDVVSGAGLTADRSGGSLPWGLVGAAALSAVGLLGAFAWWTRRRARTRGVAG